MTAVAVMPVVFVLLVVVIVVVEAKDTACAGAVINTLVEVVAIDVVDAVAIALGFALPVSYSVYVLSDVVVDLVTGAFAGVIAGMLLSGSGVDALVYVNVNVFAGVMTVRFAISAP